MKQIYTEKEILADALEAEKSATALYNCIANECVHANIRETILHALEQEHAIQVDVFNAMHARGFYPTPTAEQQKVDQAIQKFAASATNC